MKRFLSIFLCALLLLELTACQSAGKTDPDILASGDTSVPSSEAPSTEATEETEPTATSEPTEATEATETVPPCEEHTFGEWAVTTAAACEKPGVQTRVCTVCGAEETEQIEALEHTYGQWQVTATATCTSAGSQERTCSICGNKEKGALAAVGHKFGDWQVTTAATCTTAGTRTHKCTVCGQSASETIAASHSWGSWTVTKQERYPNPGEKARSCSACGAKETAVYTPTDAEKNAMALAVARQIVARVDQAYPKGTASDFDRVSYAAGIVASYSQSCHYADDYSDKDYRTPYGVFCKGLYTCAGSTRAMGMVLELMGFKWSHANENQNSHQWCRLTMDGQPGYADGQVGWVGYGDHPYG